MAEPVCLMLRISLSDKCLPVRNSIVSGSRAEDGLSVTVPATWETDCSGSAVQAKRMARSLGCAIEALGMMRSFFNFF